MKPSIYGYIILVTTVVFAVLQIIFGNVLIFGSFGIITAGFVMLSTLLLVVSYNVYKATKKRKVSESTAWFFIFAGSIFCFLLSLASILRFSAKSYPVLVNALPQVFSILTYISFMIGMFFSLRHFRGQKKVNPWVPFIIISLILIVGIYLMVSKMSANSFATSLIIGFAIYIIFDGVMLYITWMNAATTWGGKVAWSYTLLAIGFFLLVISHIQLIFVVLNKVTPDGYLSMQSTPLFLISVGILGMGGDLRLSIEQGLET